MGPGSGVGSGSGSDAGSDDGSGIRGIFDPELLSACISCGFCLPTCPTYSLTLDERSSPRGRITLMRAIEAGRVDLEDPAAREQSSFCLGCRACEPVCPAGVQYGALLEQWRDATWTGTHTPPVAAALRGGVRITPALTAAGTLRRAARTTGAATDRARGEGVALMLGCAERALFPAVSRAVTTLLPGIEVPSGQGCCGALHAHNGASQQGAAMARELGEVLPGTILTTSGGCAAHLLSVLGRERVRELSEYLVERWADPTDPSVPTLRRLQVGGREARIALQDSCHARNALGATAQPRALIARVGQYVELAHAGTCCGAAGTYSLVRPADSKRILDPKLDEIEASGVDILVTVNPGCLQQVRSGLRRRRSKARVLHIAELLVEALADTPGPAP